MTQSPFPPGAPPSPLALRVWNEAQGIDWQALELLTEAHGISDIEILIAELLAIRDFLAERNRQT